MPWIKDDVDDHKKGLTDKEKDQWVKIANSVYESCLADGGTDEECAPKAIKQANGATESKAAPVIDKEVRILDIEDAEVRAVGNSRKIEGYGIVFNKKSLDLGGFREVIVPEAVEGVFERSDVLALLNHDVSKGVLARSTNGKGTMALQIDAKGVRYSFDAPKFDLGDELLEGVRRGDIKGSSFSFTLEKDEWDYKQKPALRTIKKFSMIYDMSPVYHEAYPDTTVALRNLDKLKEEVTETETKAEEVEVKPVAEEPVMEPITERTEPEPEVKEPVVEQRNINNLKIIPMTIKELQDLKAQAYEENKKIFAQTKQEKRSQTETETEIIKANSQKMLEYELEIETETRQLGANKFVGPWIGITKKEEFSLIKTIKAMVDNREMPIAATDLTLEGRDQYQKSAITDFNGRLVIPIRDTPWKYEKRADILAGTANQGQEIVSEDKKAILPPLLPRLIFSQAGATYMTGLVGNVSIPSYAGTTVAWKTEVEAAADGGGGFKEVNFAPLRLTAYVNVSKTFLAQDGVGAEALLLDNIAGAVTRMLEKTVLGPATLVANTQPSGIGYKLNVANGGGVAELTGVTITNAALIGLETTVDTANALDGNLAYITNSIGRGLLKGIDKGVANDTGDFLCSEDNKVNGYPLLVTNSIVSTYGTGGTGNMVVFGNWKDLMIAQWGGYDITVDPYTMAKTNQVQIVINCYFDAKGLRGLTGAGATLDEYAKSFSALSIL